jgi:uncharacterized protein
MAPPSKKGWNPYLAGALTGLVMVLSVWLTGKYFGVSTSFVVTAGMLENLLAPVRASGLTYFVNTGTSFDWQWLFVVGILCGAFLAAKFFEDFQWQAVPPMWQGRFGPSRWKRGAVAFVGGAVAMFGARLADG